MGIQFPEGEVRLAHLADRVDLIAAMAFEAGLDTGASVLTQMAALLRALPDETLLASTQQDNKPALPEA